MDTTPLQFRRKLFFEILRDASRDKEDPVSEWDFKEVVNSDGDKQCICSTPIQYLYRIENRYTHTTLEIGSECIQRWFQGILRCQRCRCVLGNITKRLRKQNFHCRSCKKILQEEEAAVVQRKQSTMGQLTLFWYGPYYQKKFCDVIDDIPYVEKLLNVVEKPKTLQLFEAYVKKVYEVVEI
jgi:hypothetical protein